MLGRSALRIKHEHGKGRLIVQEMTEHESVKHVAESKDSTDGRPVGYVEEGHGVVRVEDLCRHVDEQQCIAGTRRGVVAIISGIGRCWIACACNGTTRVVLRVDLPPLLDVEPPLACSILKNQVGHPVTTNDPRVSMGEPL